jgi:2-polyprenyl-3-methyl-5-hydroxy-6-metoxy-1,4-benzoquinol methylase/rubredoxin
VEIVNNWQQRWQAALQDFHRSLFDHDRRVLKEEYSLHVDCPSCGHDRENAAFMFEKDMFRYYRCRRCGLVYMNPRMNDAATAAFYNSNVNEIYNEGKFGDGHDDANADNQINAENVRLLEKVRGAGAKGFLLEIGCAKGYFLKQARDAGYAVWGLELNKSNCAYAANILGETILDKDLMQAGFKDGMFDVVYMRDVIEHLPNPRAIMCEIARILKPGGMVFIETHNIDGLIHAIVRGKHTVIFGFEHPVHWSPRSMKYLLEHAGFKFNKVMFESADFTILRVWSYFVADTFTTVFPRKMSVFSNFMARALASRYAFFPLNKLDQWGTPKIANMFGRGSTMKVFARKAG